jgi:hypothetical protein
MFTRVGTLAARGRREPMQVVSDKQSRQAMTQQRQCMKRDERGPSAIYEARMDRERGMVDDGDGEHQVEWRTTGADSHATSRWPAQAVLWLV